MEEQQLIKPADRKDDAEDYKAPDFGNEDSRLFHEKVLRHDIQQVEEEIENIRWKQRDLQEKQKRYVRKYVIPLILLAVLLLIAILDFHHKLDVYMHLGKWETTLHIRRHPLNGRNFEYFSEDPYLTGEIAAAQLAGLRKAGTTGTIKHFCGNGDGAE